MKKLRNWENMAEQRRTERNTAQGQARGSNIIMYVYTINTFVYIISIYINRERDRERS